MKNNDLTNKKFNRLLVIEKVASINHRSAYNCLCDCGNMKIVKAENLKSNDTKSCGCLNNENVNLDLRICIQQELSLNQKMQQHTKYGKIDIQTDFYSMTS